MSTEDNKFAQQTEATAPVDKKPSGGSKDFCMEISTTVQRQPGDRVTCTWIHGNSYRLNWWSPASAEDYDNPAMTGLLVTTHRVRKSEFLDVKRTATGLVMKPIAGASRATLED